MSVVTKKHIVFLFILLLLNSCGWGRNMDNLINFVPSYITTKKIIFIELRVFDKNVYILFFKKGVIYGY